MAGIPDREDVDIVIAGIFDLNRRLGAIQADVRVIRSLLEVDNGEEEEED